MNKFLELILKDPRVYYIYQSDLSIFDIPTEEMEYIVIVHNDYELPKQYKECVVRPLSLASKRPLEIKVDNIKFNLFLLKHWFDKVLVNDILAWQCSCLNKKFILKEHVKLMLSSDSLALRKCVDNLYDLNVKPAFKQNNIKQAKLDLFEVLKYAKFANQIINNHKIVNYREVQVDYNTLNACKTFEELAIAFSDLSKNPIKFLEKQTDESLRYDKIKKVLNGKNNNA